MESGLATEKAPVSLVRIAASTRPFLLGLRWYVAFMVVGNVLRRLEVTTWVDDLRLAGLPLAFAYWLYNRRHAVWIEQDDQVIRVRKRRWSDFSGQFRRRPLRRGRVIHEHLVTEAVRYDNTSSWWRVDRGLHVGSTRYAVYPEGRALAVEHFGGDQSR